MKNKHNNLLKAVNAYIDSCEYKSINDCWYPDNYGNIPSVPNKCTRENCENVKGFIKKYRKIKYNNKQKRDG